MKILAHTYKVILDKKLDFNDRTSAQCNFGSLIIKVCPDYPETRQQEGLMHEIIEAINYHLSLKLDHDNIERLGEAIFQVLNDNGIWKKYEFREP